MKIWRWFVDHCKILLNVKYIYIYIYYIYIYPQKLPEISNTINLSKQFIIEISDNNLPFRYINKATKFG